MKYLALIALLALPAFADDLVYQSQTLAGTSTELDGGIDLGPQPINDVYTVTVTVAGPLAPNLNMAMITPKSWTVVCQSCAQDLSSTDPDMVNPSLTYIVATAAVFLFSTDQNGKITAWNFAITGNSTVTDDQGNVSSQNSGSFNSGTSGDAGTSSEFSDDHQYDVTTAGPTGSWTQSSLAVTQAPAPSAAVSRPAQKYSPQVRLWFGRL